MNIKKNRHYILLGISVLVIAITLVFFINDQIQNRKAKKIEDDVVDNTTVEEEVIDDIASDDIKINIPESDYYRYKNLSFINVSFSELLNKNSDTVAWLQVPGTGINYPVVQANDNDYYLKRSFDKSLNINGWIFMDFRNDINNLDQNTIIYGHSGTNDIMFELLFTALNQSWLNNKNNQFIKLATPNSSMIFEVFSIYTIPNTADYIAPNYDNDDNYLNFLNKLQGRSKYDFGITLEKTDKILTLSTCSNDADRLVLHARLIASRS